MKNCYWISSDEPLLREEAADAIRSQARTQGFTRHIFHIDARFDWNEFRSQAGSLSLFSDKQLIECRLHQGRLGDTAVKAINEYLEQNNPDVCVVLTSPKIEASAKKTKWFKQLSTQIDMQIIWPPQGGDFVRFLKQRASQYKLALEPEALQCLAENTEGNLLAAKQILEQLNLLADNKTISLEQVQVQLHDASKFDIYQLLDTALAGDTSKTVRVFYKLLEEDAAPTLILWALHREVTQLLKIQAALAQGEDYSRLASQYRIFGPRKSLLQRALQRLDTASLQSMVPRFGQIDQQIKSQCSDEGINQLLDLYILLSGARISMSQAL